jgi:hypothetical protein
MNTKKPPISDRRLFYIDFTTVQTGIASLTELTGIASLTEFAKMQILLHSDENL